MALNREQSEFKELMDIAGWSAAETARRLGMSRGGVSQILSGKNTPTQSLQLLRHLVLQKQQGREQVAGHGESSMGSPENSAYLDHERDKADKRRDEALGEMLEAQKDVEEAAERMLKARRKWEATQRRMRKENQYGDNN